MNFDILIIGGGHAGTEAAYIASQFSQLKIGLITMPGIGIASAPCNPSVGGVGKGQVVREIDALGGITGKLADLAGLQFRTLNESKGFAVQSTRVQIDKIQYSKNAEDILSSLNNLIIIREKISSIKKVNDNFIVSSDCSTWNTKKLIMTIGTFLNGKMHTGEVTSLGGRDGCESSDGLEELFGNINTLKVRFKTGTPARLNKDSINYALLEEQPSDPAVETFHVLHGTNDRFIDQKSCYLAYTNESTMQIIRDNKERSPMFTGQIKGVGARYCPSIEDKAFRYPDKNKHHVFVEPESHDLNTVYPSGISTSLPKDAQEDMIKTISGLENAKIEVYGYAVEYDVLDTTQLNMALEMKSTPGLFFAGQVNGTSGYEEAAGQGLIAGMNAALSAIGKEYITLPRSESYIGVMIGDLVSNVRDEPYRLFTARSENRLYIREDNSTLRMAKYREKLGLTERIDKYNKEFLSQFEILMDIISKTYIGQEDKYLINSEINVPRRMSISELIRQSSLDPVKTLDSFCLYYGIKLNKRVVRAVAITAKYDGYINKSSASQAKLSKIETKKIDWEKLIKSENISFECKQRIEKIKPETFGQLSIMEGIRPATLAAVAAGFN